MIAVVRALACFVVVMLWAAPWTYAADVDRAAVDFKTPADIKWVRNAAGTNESAGAKDEETIIQVWGMGPATSTPAEKR